ncbi:MAG: polyhydroxyalkanoate depolymerase [Alphaproteobacteria bacterium]|nr:polyhydroxyalkanoate depolymerase [Alphaproteobacteria bacterium]
MPNNMLYTLRDLQQVALTPLQYGAEMLRDTFLNGANPLSETFPGRVIAAEADMMLRLTRRFEQPAFNITETMIGGKKLAVTECDIMDLPFCSLKHFQVQEAPANRPKLLVGAPLSGHFSTLLRGTVEALLPFHDVYITDWKNSRDIPLSQAYFDLDDCIEYYMEFLRELGPNVHVLGVCQPSVPILMAVSMLNKLDKKNAPRSMILMGGPVDTRINPTEVNRLAMEHPLEWFEKKAISVVPPWYPGALRRVYPGFLQLTGFMSMNLDRHIDSYYGYFNDLIKGNEDGAKKHREFYNEYLSVMDISAEFYLQTVERVFQKHLLPKGEFKWRDHLVDLGDITETALLCIEGELDDISAVGQTEAAIPLCRNLPTRMKKHHLQLKAGHYGLFNGTRWREEVRPLISEFIHEFERGKRANAARIKTNKPTSRHQKPLSGPITPGVVTAAIVA